jgi:hypothetical protein
MVSHRRPISACLRSTINPLVAFHDNLGRNGVRWWRNRVFPHHTELRDYYQLHKATNQDEYMMLLYSC